MSKLALLAAEFRDTAAKLADLELPPEVVADTLESISGAIDVKAQSVAHVIRSLEADAAAVAQWAKDATARAKAIDARAENLRQYLARTLLECGIQRVEGPGVTLSFRTSSAVVIDDPAQVPAEYCVAPPAPPPVPSKTLVGDALKAGVDVPGARIETRQNLQIK